MVVQGFVLDKFINNQPLGHRNAVTNEGNNIYMSDSAHNIDFILELILPRGIFFFQQLNSNLLISRKGSFIYDCESTLT